MMNGRKIGRSSHTLELRELGGYIYIYIYKRIHIYTRVDPSIQIDRVV